jgi:uncharacterized membrane protein (UPF0136 family)
VKNYPASITALLLIAGGVTTFLTDNGWSPPIAAGVGIVAGAIPFVAAKITEYTRKDQS